MATRLVKWDVYEISSESSKLEGIMLRGRIRKFALLNNINLLVENASDKKNTVRFAVVGDKDLPKIINKLKEIVSDSNVNLVIKGIANPVLSKLKVNMEDRYKL